MRINIAAHGRFYAFDLARAYLELGHDVQLLTNYPRSVVARFGFPRERTRSLLWHGVAARVAPGLEPVLKRQFGTWVARRSAHGVDVLRCWSGVAEESFRSTTALRVLTRSSAHIRAQDRLLRDEATRTGAAIERPSRWIIEREEREYALSDLIVVPSEFAARTFADTPYADKVVVVPLTASVQRWRPSPAVVAQRIERIQAGHPLRLLYTGHVSFRKGMYDLGAAMDRLGGEAEFRLVGSVTRECTGWRQRYAGRAQFDGHVAEAELQSAYAWADLFVFPTIEDGFGVVLSQAQASALPFIATENCAAREIVAGGGRGSIIPPRAPDALADTIKWYSSNRAQLVEAIRALYDNPPARSWAAVAEEELHAIMNRTM